MRKKTFQTINHVTFSFFKEDAVGGGVLDKIIFCSWDDMNSVLKDWDVIMKNYKKISVDICLNFFSEHPSYKNLFPSFAEIDDEDLPNNESFKLHSYAVLRGIDGLMSYWSGKYENENEILSVISRTHVARGVTLDMMYHLKESLMFICCNYLRTTRKEKACWQIVIDHIFDEYLCSAFEKIVKPGEGEDESA